MCVEFTECIIISAGNAKKMSLELSNYHPIAATRCYRWCDVLDSAHECFIGCIKSDVANFKPKTWGRKLPLMQ